MFRPSARLTASTSASCQDPEVTVNHSCLRDTMWVRLPELSRSLESHRQNCSWQSEQFFMLSAQLTCKFSVHLAWTPDRQSFHSICVISCPQGLHSWMYE